MSDEGRFLSYIPFSINPNSYSHEKISQSDPNPFWNSGGRSRRDSISRIFITANGRLGLIIL